MVTQSAAVACGPLSVRSNELALGPTVMPRHNKCRVRSEGMKAQTTADTLARVTPLQCVASAEVIAQSILFLCSPAASHITSALLQVDGGFAHV